MILRRKNAFTLLEVVLAVGVISLTLLVLVAFLARSARQLTEIQTQDQAEALAGRLDAFLRDKDFNTLYSWVAENSQKVLFFYTYQPDDNPEGKESTLREFAYAGLQDELSRSTGPVLKIILKNSPLSFRSHQENGITGSLPASPGDYPKGYLALEAWVYAETMAGPGAPVAIGPDVSANNFITVFTYAVTRTGLQ